MIHLLGLVGSALIVLSTMMRTVDRLRLFALVGSGTFVLYGLMLPAWPVAITNVVTTSVHLYRLHQLRRLQRTAPDSPTAAVWLRRLAVGRRRASA